MRRLFIFGLISTKIIWCSFDLDCPFQNQCIKEKPIFMYGKCEVRK